ncbi:hypothetical protein BDA99DRAFT_568838 [Phascolomyces articulosus]|uniref:Uncharacterized protein n=1 Tax=Phascolomyces articulosus TaxID=60185 RepID=A0AAD5PHU0_9FUNG|nr:hypothetical protein BDA99DRAFT_533278 [Phascolomyces articulosus]KAI9274660.1 hypothetical protein BDA99DRAFT_568838 [Phascolomyces articulosus]
MQQYCGNIFNKYCANPIALTLCVNNIRNEYEQDFQESNKSVCIKMLPSKYYAKCLKYQDDPTVQLLYSIAQDVLVNVCQETKNQFKRIHDALEGADNPVSKMARSYASAGFVYSDTCLRKYTHPIDSAAALLSETVSWPDGVIGQIGRSVPVLPSLLPLKTMTDMEFVDKFAEEWRKQHSRISWMECYKQSVEKYSSRSISYKSPKVTYYESQRSKNTNNTV